MDILLIAPASGHWRLADKARLFNGKTFRFSMLSLLTVARLSPPDAHIRIVDEQVEEVPLDAHADLVGITCMTATAPRAYELAAHFQRRGIPVVLGGFHPTLNTAEALEHADAVVAGPAYGAWEHALADWEAGQLGRVYHGNPDGPYPVHLPRHLLASTSAYLTVNATFATLGCARGCRFCSISAFHHAQRRQRPVADVAEEIAAFRERFFIFVDDDLAQDRPYAMALLKELAPLRKRWVTQVSMDAAEDPSLLDAMAAAGCIGVFVGLETFQATALQGQEKCYNQPETYGKAVAAFHRRGMYVEAGVVFGFDGEHPTVFRETLCMLNAIGIDAIQASILTPLPGTPLFESKKHRIVDWDWSHYDYRHAVFEPDGPISRQELQDGADWVIRQYYRPGRIIRRLCRWLCMPGGWRTCWYPLGLNAAYWGRVIRFRIMGGDPAGHLAAPSPVTVQPALSVCDHGKCP